MNRKPNKNEVFMQKILLVLILGTLVAIFMFAYQEADKYSEWQSPSSVTESLAIDMTEYLAEEGLLYPSNDLDDPLLDHRVVVINNAINEHTSKEVVRKLLYLNSLDNTLPITLYISTQGGWYDSAFTIIETFHAIDAPVNTICTGGCYSAGAVLVASGTGERSAFPTSLFSMHISYGSNGTDQPFGTPEDRENEYIQKITKLPASWFPLEHDRSYYLSVEQALEYGLIDEIKPFKDDKPAKVQQEKAPSKHLLKRSKSESPVENE
jgi:ATP-dependent Clp protease protease subunit